MSLANRPRLHIVGLGPGGPGQMSRAAWDTIMSAGTILARTRVHPTIAFLEDQGVRVDSCDDLYENSASFEDAYAQICARVIEGVLSAGALTFAVPGHPLVGEDAVRQIRLAAAQESIDVEIVSSPGFLDVVLPAAGLDIGQGLRLVDATRPTAPDPSVPTVYYQVYNRMVASDLKLTLMDSVEDDALIWHIRSAGGSQMEARKIPLYELDRVESDHLTSVVVPVEVVKSGASLNTPVSVVNEDDAPGAQFERLIGIMAALRSPDGCPWDREQDLDTLRQYVLEEAYEVVDCIDRRDVAHLPDELGDLLLQVVFQSQIGAEDGLFTIHDVLDCICDKLIRRHPHVFGDVFARDSAEVLRNWDAIKKMERAGANGATVLATEVGGPIASALDGIALALPAVQRADKVFRRAARVGFDWPDHTGPLDKVVEELNEIREALAHDPDNVAAEVGDLFLAAINVARKLDLDPEEVTRTALDRFVRRFRAMESLVFGDGRSLAGMEMHELDRLWELAKVGERAG